MLFVCYQDLAQVEQVYKQLAKKVSAAIPLSGLCLRLIPTMEENQQVIQVN